MTQLYKNKYRIPSARLPAWDYASPGAYFITLCTHNRIWWFGDVKNAKMVLSDIGEIVDDEWLKTGEIRPNVELDEYVVMPNHFHVILIIKNDDGNNLETPRGDVSKPHNKIETTGPVVSATLQPNSLGSIVGQFKSVCTKRIRKLNHPHFHWQSRFYDHIVRSEKDYYRIREYIRNNPCKWQDDRNFSKG